MRSVERPGGIAAEAKIKSFFLAGFGGIASPQFRLVGLGAEHESAESSRRDKACARARPLPEVLPEPLAPKIKRVPSQASRILQASLPRSMSG